MVLHECLVSVVNFELDLRDIVGDVKRFVDIVGFAHTRILE